MEKSVAFVKTVIDTWVLLVQTRVNFVTKRTIFGSTPWKYFKVNFSGLIQMSEHTTPAINTGLSTWKQVFV